MFTALITKAKVLGSLGILGGSVALTAPAGARMLHDRVLGPAANHGQTEVCAPAGGFRGHDFDRHGRFPGFDHRDHRDGGHGSDYHRR